MAEVRIETGLVPARRIRGLAALWQDLQARADHSFFQSWGWISTWLAWLPAGIEPVCLVARAGGQPVGLGLLVARRARRHGVIAARGLHLHETGDRQLDQITIEYNGLLLDRRDPAAVAAACLARLKAETGLWNELYLPGVDPAWIDRARAVGTPDLLQDSPCPFVDLTAGEDSWWRGLSGSARQQLRRAQRLYGEVEVEHAGDLRRARNIWGELKDLHQAAWQARGEPGAFANDAFTAFHERLIPERLGAGEIELLRLRSAAGTIACLYNFFYEGRVLSYQSGVALEDDNRRKPGLVAHAAAIAYARTRGAQAYDFLAGEARYKRSLAADENRLVWLAVRRPTAAFAAERGLRRLKESLRRLRRRGEPPDPAG